MRTAVHLGRAGGYNAPGMGDTVGRLIEAAGFLPGPGTRVLVKPNLVAARGGPLSCTHPAVVRAACSWLLDQGARVTVADSPAFGTAGSVATKVGLAEVLKPLGLTVRTLGRPEPLRLSFGPSVGVSKDALEAEAILNLPKVKAHGQLGLSLAVKNLFGCVVGFRKAFSHTRFGDQGNLFESLVVEVMQALPPGASLADGITAMSRKGPTGGDPYPLGLLAASASPVALDTALYGILGASPENMAVWRESLRRGLLGARPEEIEHLGEPPETFDASGFVLPARLDPVTFHPVRLIRGRIKSFCARFL